MYCKLYRVYKLDKLDGWLGFYFININETMCPNLEKNFGNDTYSLKNFGNCIANCTKFTNWINWMVEMDHDWITIENFNDSVRDAAIRWEDLIDNYCWGMMAKFRWWSKYISLLTSYRWKNCIMHFPYKDEIHDAITSTRYKLVRSLSVLDNPREKYILYFSF